MFLLFLLLSVTTYPLHGHSNQAQHTRVASQAGHVGPHCLSWRGGTVALGQVTPPNRSIAVAQGVGHWDSVLSRVPASGTVLLSRSQCVTAPV